MNDAAPHLDARHQAHREIERARDNKSTNRILDRWDNPGHNLEHAQEVTGWLHEHHPSVIERPQLGRPTIELGIDL